MQKLDKNTTEMIGKVTEHVKKGSTQAMKTEENWNRTKNARRE